MNPKSKGDADGYKRGACGYGEPDESDLEFLRPNFDAKKLYGETAVGQRASVGDGRKLNQKD